MIHLIIVLMLLMIVGSWILALVVFVSDPGKFWNDFGPRKNYIVNTGIIFGSIFGICSVLFSFPQQDPILLYVPKYIVGMIVSLTGIFMTWAVLNRIDGMVESAKKRDLERMKEETRARLLADAETKGKSRDQDNI